MMGYDLAGVVAAIGSSVTSFKVGDEVYSRAPDRGSIAQYALTPESATALKPKLLTFSEAAAIPLAALTALQSLRKGDEKIGLKGKTVFIPAGLSGTGSFGVQLAKNAFGVKEVITTVSTAKVSKIKELLGNSTPDRVVDYTKEDIVKAVGEGTVDYMFDVTKSTIPSLPLMKKGGVIISISTVPSGQLIKSKMPGVSSLIVFVMDIVDWYYRTRTSWGGVDYSKCIRLP
jgi:NADPH:quinone reductase-like Zn-dependent oxidoreductase